MNKNLLTGILFIVFSIVFGLNGFRYTVGNFADPGAGLFPIAVSVFLLVLGLIIIIKSRLIDAVPVDFKFRNIIIISLALLGFAVATEYCGMILGIVILASVASTAASTYSIARVIKITIGLVLITLAFKYLLGLNLPL